MTTSKQLTTVLHAILGAIENLSEEDVSAIAEGRKVIRVSLSDKPARKSKASEQTKVIPEEIIHNLKNLSSREEGADYIHSLHLRVADLTAIAKAAGAYVSGHDRIEQLREKVIAETIGYRTGSVTIQDFDQGKTTRR